MRGIGVVLWLAASGALAQPIDKDPETMRLDQQAKLLFVTVLKDLHATIETCGIEATWSSYAVPYDVAHKALGLEVHANLESPDHVAGPAEVIGPAVANDAFCDKEGRKAHEKGLVEAWQKAFQALPWERDRRPRPSFPSSPSRFLSSIALSHARW